MFAGVTGTLLKLAAGIQTDRADIASNLLHENTYLRELRAGGLTDARVLLLDEVFSGIDRGRCAEILDALREEAKRIAYPARGSEERTFFIVTHDDEIAARCDRVLQI